MKLTSKQRQLVKEYAKKLQSKKLNEDSEISYDNSDDNTIIHINLDLTKQEYSELIAAIWDKSSSATGSKKKMILKSLSDKFEKYYK